MHLSKQAVLQRRPGFRQRGLAPRRPQRPYGVYVGGVTTSPPEPQEDAESRRQRVEAVLLLAKGPVKARKLAQLAALDDATEARTLIRQLNELYDAAGRAMRAEAIAGGYQLLTRPQYAPWLRRLGHIPAPIRLSSPAMETLAIVAYRQPVLRADVEAIRGVASGELLRQLMERDLVRISGRSEELGRPFLYSTSKRFLQIFGLHSVDALPNIRFDMLPLAPPDSNSDPSDTSEESDVSIALAPSVLENEDPFVAPSVVAPSDGADVPGDSVAGVSATGVMPAVGPAAAIEDDDDWVADDDDDEEDDDEDDDDWDDDDDDWDDDDDDEEDDEEEDVDEDVDDVEEVEVEVEVDDDEEDDDEDEEDEWVEVGDDDDDLDDDLEDDEDDLDEDEEDWD